MFEFLSFLISIYIIKCIGLFDYCYSLQASVNGISTESCLYIENNGFVL